MRLYTQEQLDLAFLKGHSLGGLGVKYTLEIVEDMRKELTPIELPTDEEIQKESYKIQYGGGSNGWIQDGFRKGAKMVINKIQGGNK